jgi:hypothetical protein
MRWGSSPRGSSVGGEHLSKARDGGQLLLGISCIRVQFLYSGERVEGMCGKDSSMIISWFDPSIEDSRSNSQKGKS